MAEYRQSKTPSSRGKRLSKIELKEGEDGGHVVTHHFAEDGLQYHKPKDYVFGNDEGADLLHHVAKCMNVSGPDEEGTREKADEETAVMKTR